MNMHDPFVSQNLFSFFLSFLSLHLLLFFFRIPHLLLFAPVSSKRTEQTVHLVHGYLSRPASAWSWKALRRPRSGHGAEAGGWAGRWPEASSHEHGHCSSGSQKGEKQRLQFSQDFFSHKGPRFGLRFSDVLHLLLVPQILY